MTQAVRATTITGRDVEVYRRMRARMPGLASGLSAEDLAAQTMSVASPGG